MEKGTVEDIVISGISGRFPSSQNVDELAKNLYEKIYMCTDKECRWSNQMHPNIPKRKGVIDDLNRFDAPCFNINSKQAEKMAPEGRILLEKAYEAILDAGINPKTMRGSNTAVIVAQNTSDSLNDGVYKQLHNDQFNLMGSINCMLANRVSFSLGLRGSSMVIDAACASSLMALQSAVNLLRLKECDAALVCAANMQLLPNISHGYVDLNVLSADGYSRPFDKDANGFVRSDAVIAILLQKRTDAKRIYANIEHIVSNVNSFSPDGISNPNSDSQCELFKKLYTDIGVDPLDVHFVEAHSTGTRKGDPVECNAIYKAFCENRKEPLLVGSIKSNLGHAEAAAGLCSIIKGIFTFETGLIPPNINFTETNPNIPSLVSGHLKVCTEATPLKGSFIAIDSFGIGGSNAHLLLRKEGKFKENLFDRSLPRLICWSGRTKEAVHTVFDKLKSIPIDIEFIGLLHNIQKTPIIENLHRGYILVKSSDRTDALPKCLNESTSIYDETERPVVWYFSGMGSQWPQMARSLMQIPSFYDSILKCHQSLLEFNVDLISMITTDESPFENNILNCFVGITAVQIALVDLLKLLAVPSNYIIGHSMGEIGCAYADGAFTLKQSMISSYYRGKFTLSKESMDGEMAAIGLGYNDIKNILPPNIDAACHNSANSCTISGPRADVQQYVSELQAKHIFAKKVETCNWAFHSRYMAPFGPQLLALMEKYMPNKVKRSSKWLSTSVPIDQWHTDDAKFSSAKYFVNNVLGPVYLEETAKLLPENAICIEIGPTGFMQTILKSLFPNAVHVPLTLRKYGDQSEFLLMALGKLYLHGISVQIDRLYPEVDFPVSHGTPKISSLIKWNHEKNWPIWQNKPEDFSQIEKTIVVNLSNAEHEYMAGHKIDGCCLMPAMSILDLVKTVFIEVDPHATQIVFEDVKLLSATVLKRNLDVKISISIDLLNGRFQVCEESRVIANGFIKRDTNAKSIHDTNILHTENTLPILNADEIYKEFRLRGYNFSGEFQSMHKALSDASAGQIKWRNNWATFTDAILQLATLALDTRSLGIPTEIRRIRFSVDDNVKSLNSVDSEKICDIYYFKDISTFLSDSMEITGIKFTPVERRKQDGVEMLQTYQFLPLVDQSVMFEHVKNALSICVQLALEKLQIKQIKLAEVLANNNNCNPTIDFLYEIFNETPKVVAGLTLFAGSNEVSLINADSIKCERSSLDQQSDFNFIVMNKCLNDVVLLETAKHSLSENGFLIAIDNVHCNLKTPTDFTLVSMMQSTELTIRLIQRTPPESKIDDFTVINVNSEDEHFQWLKHIQKTDITANLLLIEQNKTSGLMGFTKSLRLEPETNHFRCVIIEDEGAPPFDVKNPLYQMQLALQLPINIYKNGKWGTYRHIPLKYNPIQCESKNRLTASINQIGDLRSLHWIPETEYNQSDEVIRIQYAALNFRDTLIATGTLPIHMISKNRFDEYRPMIGFEYAGVHSNGKRVMCMNLNGGSLSTQAHCSNADILLEVPDEMSLRDAASIPLVYFTIYYSFFVNNSIEAGKSILIHAGSGGVGLAAIRVALAYGLEVFTTVSTQQKKEFILKEFPKLKEQNIGNSRDCSFKELIMKATKGDGVDFVLNSLSDDKLKASIRCLRRGGIFLELGRSDIINDTELGMSAFLNGITIRAIMADHVAKVTQERNKVVELMKKDLVRGIIQPLPTTVFAAKDVESAFRFLAAGKHIGKVLIQIRDEERSETSLPIMVTPTALFDAKLVYLLVGGLGGFGLELADWMVMRGAKILVLCSRRGISDEYQRFRIQQFESYGCKIIIYTENVITFEGCVKLLNASMKLGEIGGIFNLAVVLTDGILSNQTPAKFSECFAPKVRTTKHLDTLSRLKCPKIEHFVVFSSFVSAYGNAGQSNYSMANEIIEKIVEQRAHDKFAGKAIQWGAIGDVGLVAKMLDGDNSGEIFGRLPQRIDKCLSNLDKLLTNDKPIVACALIPVKKAETVQQLNLAESVFHILGVDRKSISMSLTLGQLGLDSLMVVEVRQMLQREFNISLDNGAIKELTVGQLNDISKSNKLKI